MKANLQVNVDPGQDLVFFPCENQLYRVPRQCETLHPGTYNNNNNNKYKTYIAHTQCKYFHMRILKAMCINKSVKKLS